MPGDVSIRFVTRQDYARWLPLWDGYNAFYERTGPTAFNTNHTAVQLYDKVAEKTGIVVYRKVF